MSDFLLQAPGWPMAIPLASGLLSLALAVLAARRVDRPEVRAFIALCLIEALWSAFMSLELLSSGIRGKAFWDDLQFPASLAAPVAFVALARSSVGRPFRRPLLSYLALAAPAIASAPIALAEDGGLVRIEPSVDWAVPMGELVYGFTLFDFLLFAWGLALAAYAIGELVASLRALRGTARSRILLMSVAYLFPLMGNVLALAGIRLAGHRDSSPLWFAACNLLLAFALFRLHLMDIRGVARRVVVDSLGDPVLVLDADGILLDCNRAFAALMGARAGKLRGSDASALFSAWPAQAREFLIGGQGEAKARVEGLGEERVFEIQVSPAGAARVAVLRDVTELTRAERRLRDWHAELEDGVRSRTAELELEVEQRRRAEADLYRINEGIASTQREIMVTLSGVVESRSPETANHVLRVGEYARVLGEAFGLAPENVALLADAAPMHDIGKVAVPDSILNKPGSLDEAERAVMREHARIGWEILSKSERSLLRAAAVIALDHHERWDGLGYPAGKKGEAISLSGRIVCACDIFDALSTDRIYKRAWELPAVLAFFREESNRTFDPRLTELLFLNLDRFLAIARRWADEG